MYMIIIKYMYIMSLNVCWRPKFHKNAHFMKSKEGPIQAVRRINIKAQFMFRFPVKRSSKSPTKPSERTGSGYPEAARGSGSSGNAAQLMWDWDSSREVPWNTRTTQLQQIAQLLQKSQFKTPNLKVTRRGRRFWLECICLS